MLIIKWKLAYNDICNFEMLYLRYTEMKTQCHAHLREMKKLRFKKKKKEIEEFSKNFLYIKIYIFM